MPPVAPAPRRSWGWIITSIILFVMLLFAGLIILGQAATRSLTPSRSFKNISAREIGPKLDECILQEGASRNKIAVIRVEGIITGSTVDQAGNNMVDVIKAQLDRASEDARVKAVILKVDSPGGEVLASDQINKAIQEFQTDQPEEHGHPAHIGKPVICSMGNLAASGGYYISAPCRWIVADELTLTGSIGVIMHGYNYRGLMDKIGVMPMTFKSGKFKDMLSPDRSTNEIPPEEHQMVQDLINDTYQKFKGVVGDGRSNAHALNKKEGHELATNWTNYADGRVLSGKQALDLGFVDQLGDFDDAVDKTESIANCGDATLIEYQERYDLSNFFSMFGQSGEAHDIKLDLGTDMPKLRAGCMYFLWEMPQE